MIRCFLQLGRIEEAQECYNHFKINHSSVELYSEIEKELNLMNQCMYYLFFLFYKNLWSNIDLVEIIKIFHLARFFFSSKIDFGKPKVAGDWKLFVLNLVWVDVCANRMECAQCPRYPIRDKPCVYYYYKFKNFTTIHLYNHIVI